jgi:hypothetical protein
MARWRRLQPQRRQARAARSCASAGATRTPIDRRPTTRKTPVVASTTPSPASSLPSLCRLELHRPVSPHHQVAPLFHDPLSRTPPRDTAPPASSSSRERRSMLPVTRAPSPVLRPRVPPDRPPLVGWCPQPDRRALRRTGETEESYGLVCPGQKNGRRALGKYIDALGCLAPMTSKKN